MRGEMVQKELQDWCSELKARFPAHFQGVWVLDIGALDTNDASRFHFDQSGTLGIDLTEGEGVDFVLPANLACFPDASFDTIFSTRYFAQDPFLSETLQNVVRMLKPGGLFFFHCATEVIHERMNATTATVDSLRRQRMPEWLSVKSIRTAADIQAAMRTEGIFEELEFATNTNDLFFWGLKKGVHSKRSNYSFSKKAQQLEQQLAVAVESAERSRQESETRIAQLNRWVQNGARELATATARNDKLQSEVEALRGQIRWFEGTRSWKVTKPLRFLARMQRQGVLGPIRTFVSHRRTAANKMESISKPVEELKKAVEELTKAVEVLKRPAEEVKKPAPTIEMSTKSVFENSNIRVMCTPHTRYIGRLFSEALVRWGYTVHVDHEYIESPETGYVVVCPQMYQKLPARFAAFQMEQSVSSRWFSPSYIERLKSAEVVFDYSKENLRFLSEAGLPMSQMFYLPITPLRNLKATHGKARSTTQQAYDFVFYGDPNAPRRQAMLEALKKEFKVLMLSEVFGDELLERLQEAKAVVNIHYYENALLETTRLSEALTQGCRVLSEGVANQRTQSEFEKQGVVFFEMGNEKDMLKQARWMLQQPSEAVLTAGDDPGFAEYLERYLLSRQHIPFDALSPQFLPAASSQEKYPRLCLSLSESPVRQEVFHRSNHFGFHVVEGMRASPGWVGCALSYKFMAREALKTKADYVVICEDDVSFFEGFREQFQTIESWLRDTQGTWDIFAGLIADLHEDCEVLDVVDVSGLTLVTVSKMTSMVFNVYSKKALSYLASWDEHNRDVETNTIDRYLERIANLRVVVPLPYLVGHSEDLHSTLWGIQNSKYNEMIERSQNRLREKVEEYLRVTGRNVKTATRLRIAR